MINDIPNLIEEIKRNIKEFTDIAIIGLSGGADSTLVAILCMLALEKDNVYGISMPEIITSSTCSKISKLKSF